MSHLIWEGFADGHLGDSVAFVLDYGEAVKSAGASFASSAAFERWARGLGERVRACAGGKSPRVAAASE